jgi:membrane protease YdiL (CAAX protease family)
MRRDPRRRLLACALVGGLLVAANLLNNLVAPWAYVPVCVITSAALILTARWAGGTWADLGLGRGTAARGLRLGFLVTAVVLAGYLAAATLPGLRELLADRRVAALGLAEVLVKVLVWVPFGTVLLEETAFRGVVYGLVRRWHGTGTATAVSSVLFGLWHLLPARRLATVNPVVAEVFGASATGRAAAYVLALSGTALAGVVFCELRRRSGSLLAPMAAHWALNGIGYLAAYARR